MEIIKKGKLPEEQEYQGTCHYCGTVVRFKQKEAEYVSDQRDGDFLNKSGCCIIESAYIIG